MIGEVAHQILVGADGLAGKTKAAQAGLKAGAIAARIGVDAGARRIKQDGFGEAGATAAEFVEGAAFVVEPVAGLIEALVGFARSGVGIARRVHGLARQRRMGAIRS